MRILHDMVKIFSQAGTKVGPPRQVRLSKQIDVMWRNGMSATAIRRALGLNAEAALAAGIIAPGVSDTNRAARHQAKARWTPCHPCRLSKGATGPRGPAKPSRAGPAMSSVSMAVAQVSGIPHADLLGPSQRRDLVRPRQLIMYLIRELCGGATLPAIGHYFGRDHTTILYGYRRAEDLLTREASVRRWRDGALQLLKPGPDEGLPGGSPLQ